MAKREKVIVIRVSGDEYDALTAAADAQDKRVSTYVRETAVGAAEAAAEMDAAYGGVSADDFGYPDAGDDGGCADGDLDVNGAATDADDDDDGEDGEGVFEPEDAIPAAI